MNRRTIRWLAFFLGVFGTCVAGCGSDDAGRDGAGGADTAMLRFAHMAPEVPVADDTAVDVVVVDEGSFLGLSFGEVSAYASLRPGVQFIDIVVAEQPETSLVAITPTLERGGVYTLVAYRDSTAEGLMGLLQFEEVSQVDPGDRGRVAIGHGADDTSWALVNVVNASSGAAIVSDLSFGTKSDSAEFAQGPLDVGFDVAPPSSVIDAGPFRLDVCADEFSILIAVDTDTVDGSVEAIVYEIGPKTVGPVPTLPPLVP